MCTLANSEDPYEMLHNYHSISSVSTKGCHCSYQRYGMQFSTSTRTVQYLYNAYLGSTGMDSVICELCHTGTILQRSYKK